MRIDLWTEGKEASLEEILDARENRVRIQKELLKNRAPSHVSFTLNIPGPVKVFPFSQWLFELGDRILVKAVEEEKGKVLERHKNKANTGYEGFYSLSLSPGKVKEILTLAEEYHPLGRLFDFDVLDRQGRKISRQELGFRERKCLLCQKPAFICSRSRRHSAAEVLAREIEMMESFYIERMSLFIGQIMEKSLLYEVNASLKPGLVDRLHNGAHQDMDLMTFVDSAYALTPYFTLCARKGLEFSGKEEELPGMFEALRIMGKEGEKIMKTAARGANPHKGMIFSGGIFCFCAGYGAGSLRLDFQNEDFPKVLGRLCRILTGNLMKDYKKLDKVPPVTHGEKLYKEHGVRGIRGEAAAGYSHVLDKGISFFEKMLEEGYSPNKAGLLTLLQYIASIEDTNMMIRSDFDTVQRIQKEMKRFLRTAGPEQQLEIIPALDAYFVKKNISPGGSADMLALTYFLYFLKKKKCPFEAFELDKGGMCHETFE